MSSYRFEMTPEEFDNYIIRAKLEEQDRIINLLESQEILATVSNPESQFAILVWQGIREQLIEAIKGKENV